MRETIQETVQRQMPAEVWYVGTLGSMRVTTVAYTEYRGCSVNLVVQTTKYYSPPHVAGSSAYGT